MMGSCFILYKPMTMGQIITMKKRDSSSRNFLYFSAISILVDLRPNHHMMILCTIQKVSDFNECRSFFASIMMILFIQKINLESPLINKPDASTIACSGDNMHQILFNSLLLKTILLLKSFFQTLSSGLPCINKIFICQSM